MAERGGSDQALLQLVRSLPRDEFTSHVVVPGPSPLAHDFAAAGARLHTLPMRRLTRSAGLGYRLAYVLGWPVVVARLAALVRSVGADVVHTNSLHSLYGWAVAALCRRPHVWHAREIVVQSDRALRLERTLARRFATVVIAMSESIAAQLDRRNVRVLIETVDTARFRPDRAGRFRAAAGIGEDVPLVGFAGRIDTWKGLDVLLEAFREVRRQMPRAELAVAGPSVPGKEGYAAGLQRRAAALDGVHWLGSIGDMPDFYADLDVFVAPSTEPEPFGLVLIEALASGVPVVSTTGGGPAEIVARNPDAGRLVPPRDPAALAAGIVEVLRRSPPRPGRRPLWDVPPPDFAAVFREVAAGRR